MRKKGKKLLLLFLALTLVFSTATLTAMAKKASAETSVSTASEDKAPDPVFMSDYWALQGASRVYYTDSTSIERLYILLKTNTAKYTLDTLTLEWQVSEDGQNFKAIEGADNTFASATYLRSNYTPEISVGETKYYRAKITNKGLVEGMTPCTVYTHVAKIVYRNIPQPYLGIEQAQVRQSDGTMAEDENLKITLSASGGSLPKKITNFGCFQGNLAQFLETAWNHDQYIFKGWQIADKFYDGTKSKENAVKAGPDDQEELKACLPREGWHVEFYFENGTYYVQYGGEVSQDGPQTILKLVPVFEKQTDMAYQINLVQTGGGTVSQLRGIGETHTLIATPSSKLYQFVRWEKSTDGESWTKIDGGARTDVTLTENTTYRAIFECPYKVDKLEVSEYALKSEGDSWFINAQIKMNQAVPTDTFFKVRAYEGDTANEENLLGEYRVRLWQGDVDEIKKVVLTKRPSSPTAKILLVSEMEASGTTAQDTYELKGTLDVTPATVDAETYETAFMGAKPAEIQLSVSGSPEVKSVLWSGGTGSATGSNNSMINEHTGLVTYSAYTSNRSVDFTAKAGDGRIAEGKVNFKETGFGTKLSANKLVVGEGETKEYQATNTNATLSVSRHRITIASSDENVFKAEFVTKEGANQFQPKDILDKVKITGVGKGTAKLTIAIGATGGHTWEWPVTVQSDKEAVTAVTLPAEQELTLGASMDLEATVTPETAATTLKWSSSNAKIVKVEDGKITALKKGSAEITVEASDKLGNTVKAICKVTVTEPPYSVELYVPKKTVGENGLMIYPTTGADENGKDTFDPAQAVENIQADTASNNYYDIYTVSLEAGTYSYRAVDKDGKNLGGGSFAFPSGNSGTLDGRTFRVNTRLAEVSVTNEVDGKKGAVGDFNVSLSNENGNVTVGDPYVNAEGYPTYPALVCANDTNLPYYLTVAPSTEYATANNAMACRKADVSVAKEASALSVPIKLETGSLTINAPADATVTIRENLADATVAEYACDATAEQEDGTVDYIFRTAITGKMYYHVSGDNYVSYNGTVEDGSKERIVVSKDMLNPSGNTKNTLDRNPASNGGANLADLYMNINAKGYLQLESGNTFQIHAMRNWWGSNVTWVLGKDYRLIEPDFHYTVVGLDGQASDNVVNVDASGKVTAVGQGTAIVLVTYDAMTLHYHDDAKYSYDNYDPNGFFGAIWPENTGVFVVSVDAEESGISTGMTLNADLNKDTSKEAGAALDAELDPIYFLGDQGTYNFTPGTEGVSVSVANPSISGNVMGYNGFVALAAKEDGSYDVPLTNGRNIVKVEKGGNAEYQVVTAKQITAQVNGKSLDNVVLTPGEKVSVKFDTLFNPVTRMRLYNTDAAAVYRKINGMDGVMAGSARGSYGYYFFGSTAAKQTVENTVETGTDGSGYNNPVVTVKDTLRVPEDFAEENFVLSEGMFNVAGFGGDYGAHRAGVKTWGSLAPNTIAWMGQLPDISVPVGTLDKIEVTTQPTKTTYNVGDVFDPTGVVVTASYKAGDQVITKEVTGFTYTKDAFATSGKQNVTITYKQGNTTKTVDCEVTVADLTVDSIEIATAPTKTVYRAGEKFDPAGMVVKAVYSDGSKKEVADYTFAPDTIGEDTTEVVVTYNGKTAAVPIELNKVTAIAVTAQPAKTEYTAGEVFNTAGMVVTATYKDGSTAETTNYSVTPSGRLQAGDTEVTIAYAGADAAENLEPVKITITVKEAQEEPYNYITTYVTYSDKGELVSGAEGTLLCKVPLKVYDRNEDGLYDMSDVFKELHRQYYVGGVDGFADSEGGWISRFWGVNTGMVSYVLNHAWVYGTKTAVYDGDVIALYVYSDTVDYADLYTWFDDDEYQVDANTECSFKVNGLNVMNSSELAASTAQPKGATITVYNAKGEVVEGLSATTDEKGEFKLTFPKDGDYTIEVSGTCSYTCAGYGGGAGLSYQDKTVVPTRSKVKVGNGEALLGDVNGDGLVNLSDAIALLNKVTAQEAIDLTVGDINGDGTVNLQDAIALLNLVTQGEN